MKTGTIIGIGAVAALVFLLAGKGESKSDSGYGGAFPIPLPQTPGIETPVEATPQAQVPATFQISDKIAAAMYGSGSVGVSGGYFASQPKKQVSGNIGGFALLPMGYGEDYVPASTKKESVASEPSFANTMQGSSRNRGGTWVGSTFHRGRYN